MNFATMFCDAASAQAAAQTWGEREAHARSRDNKTGIEKKRPGAKYGVGMSLRLLGLCSLALLISAPAFAAEQFETRLAPSPMTDGQHAANPGEGRARATLDGNRLTVSADFQGLSSSATAAQLYEGQGIAMWGPKAFDLTVTQAAAGTVTGTVTLNAKQVAALRAGHFYVQINSQKAPDGNLTGWLMPPHPFAGEGVPVQGAGFLPQFDVPPIKAKGAR